MSSNEITAMESNTIVEPEDSSGPQRTASLRGNLTRAWSSMRQPETAENKYKPKRRRSSMFVSSRNLLPEEEILDIGAMADFEQADEEDQDDGLIFVLQEEEEEEEADLADEVAEEVIVDDLSFARTSNEALGSHLLTRNMFYLEVASNRTIRVALYVVYVVFFVTLVFQLIYAVEDRAGFQPIGILPTSSSTNGDAVLCELQTDGSCPVYEAVNASQAVLLVNTGVVSNGMNVSDWDGYGIKRGTPSVTAHGIKFGSFMTDSSLLEYDANPQLHPYREEVVAMAWIGYRGGNEGSYRVIYVDLEFQRLDRQEWPKSILNDPFPVRIEGYACLRGEDCDNIGNWRLMIVDNDIREFPERKVNGKLYTARITVYSHFLGEEVVDSVAWRFAMLGDPGGAITESLLANETTNGGVLVTFGTSGERVYAAAVAIVDVIVLTAYVLFVLWWVYNLRKRCGPVSQWATENKWLLVAAIGFMISVNPIMVGLELHTFASDNAADFSQGWWCAALIFGGFGVAMTYFVFACFSDAPRRYVTSNRCFYGWKIAFCTLFFIVFAFVQVYRFPSVSGWDEPGTPRELGGLGYVTAPENWDRREQGIFAFLMSILIGFLICSFVYYAWANVRSRRVLNTLPYAWSRPMQLSSRFFFWVTSLWVLVEFVLILVDMFQAIADENIYFSHMDGLSSYVVALDRMGFLDGGYGTLYQDLFGLAFFVIFQCFFLPPECFGASGEKAKTHYISQEEADRDQSKEPQEFLMILELARLLFVCSREVYLPFESDYKPQKSQQTGPQNQSVAKSSASKYARVVKETFRTSRNSKTETSDSAKASSEDDAEKEHQAPAVELDKRGKIVESESVEDPGGDNSGSENATPPDNTKPQMPGTRFAGDSGSAPGFLPWESTAAMGCTVVAHVSEPEGTDMHNTRVLIVRHTETNDLIVAFRGTLTKKQVQTDIMSSRILVDLDTFLTTSAPKRLKFGGSPTDGMEYISPDVVEAKILSGEIKKIRLMDLLPKQGQGEVPDYLESATKVSDGIEGVCQVHFGFWSSYNRVRRELHTTIRKELVARPGRLLITGHSLGGAQATLCAYDMCRYVLPTVQKQLESSETGAIDNIEIACYSYGSPRVGCNAFKVAYNKLMPNTQRIVNDGDLVTAMPPARLGFRHIGRENIFDRVGSIRVNPALIEKKFTRSKNEVIPHKMNSYREVVQKSFHPVTNEVQLLETIRKAYYGDK